MPKLPWYRGKEVLARQQGEVQFTDYGVSGPVIFDLSRAAVTGAAPPVLELDLVSPLSQGELVDLLAEKQRLLPGLTLENLLTGVLHNRLGPDGAPLRWPEADPGRGIPVPSGPGGHRRDCKAFRGYNLEIPGWNTPRSPPGGLRTDAL